MQTTINYFIVNTILGHIIAIDYINFSYEKRD